jgi:hypothetical protein
MAGKQKIYVSEFSSTYKANEKNVELLSSALCKKGDSYNFGTLDSQDLINKFDLSNSCMFPIQVSLSDLHDISQYKNSASAEIFIWLENFYDSVGRELCMTLDDFSPFKLLFTPEKHPNFFGGFKYKNSQYSRLLLKLNAEGKKLIFDAICYFEKSKFGEIGEGKLTIKAKIPNCNDVITYLTQQGHL